MAKTNVASENTKGNLEQAPSAEYLKSAVIDRTFYCFNDYFFAKRAWAFSATCAGVRPYSSSSAGTVPDLPKVS